MTVSRSPVVAVLIYNTPMVDPNTGIVTAEWLRSFFRGVAAAVNVGLGTDGTALKMPFPAIGVLGGVQATLPVPHQWINQIDALGVPQLSQPAFSDLAGTAGIPFLSYGVGAPVAAGTQDAFYFDTTGSPYHGYVFNAGSWQQFS